MDVRRCVEGFMWEAGSELDKLEQRYGSPGDPNDLIQVRRNVLIVCRHAVHLSKQVAVSVGHMNAGQLLDSLEGPINWALYPKPYLPEHAVRFDAHPMGDGVSARERDERRRAG